MAKKQTKTEETETAKKVIADAKKATKRAATAAERITASLEKLADAVGTDAQGRPALRVKRHKEKEEPTKKAASSSSKEKQKRPSLDIERFYFYNTERRLSYQELLEEGTTEERLEFCSRIRFNLVRSLLQDNLLTIPEIARNSDFLQTARAIQNYAFRVDRLRFAYVYYEKYFEQFCEAHEVPYSEARQTEEFLLPPNYVIQPKTDANIDALKAAVYTQNKIANELLAAYKVYTEMLLPKEIEIEGEKMTIAEAAPIYFPNWDSLAALKTITLPICIYTAEEGNFIIYYIVKKKPLEEPWQNTLDTYRWIYNERLMEAFGYWEAVCKELDMRNYVDYEE